MSTNNDFVEPSNNEESHLAVNIALFDLTTSGAIVKAVFESFSNVAQVRMFAEAEEILNAFHHDVANSLLIDIFSIGVSQGVELIRKVRAKHPHVPICLLGSRKLLTELPEVPEEWKKRFNHYYLLPKDETTDQFTKRASAIAALFEVYLRNNRAHVRLKDLRNRIVHGQGAFKQLSPDSAKDISKVLAEGERALEIKQKSFEQTYFIVQGFGDEDVKKLVTETIEKASNALERTARANASVLICGALLIIASFVVASVTQRWEAITFGGFGIAGVIAALITNPLRSIGIGAKRLVILQVAYLNFLKQLSLLDSSSPDRHVSNIERSRQLNGAMEKVLEHLGKHFG
jgi:hypothetical protein